MQYSGLPGHKFDPRDAFHAPSTLMIHSTSGLQFLNLHLHTFEPLEDFTPLSSAAASPQRPDSASYAPHARVDSSLQHAAHSTRPLPHTSNLFNNEESNVPPADSSQATAHLLQPPHMRAGIVQHEATCSQQQHPEVNRHSQQDTTMGLSQSQGQASAHSRHDQDMQQHAAPGVNDNASAVDVPSQLPTPAASAPNHPELATQVNHQVSRSVWSMSSSSSGAADAARDVQQDSLASDADSSPVAIQADNLPCISGAGAAIYKRSLAPGMHTTASVTAHGMGPCFQPEQFILDVIPEAMWDKYVLADYMLQVVQQSAAPQKQAHGVRSQPPTCTDLPGGAEAVIVIVAMLQLRSPVVTNLLQRRPAMITAVINAATGTSSFLSTSMVLQTTALIYTSACYDAVTLTHQRLQVCKYAQACSC